MAQPPELVIMQGERGVFIKAESVMEAAEAYAEARPSHGAAIREFASALRESVDKIVWGGARRPNCGAPPG